VGRNVKRRKKAYDPYSLILGSVSLFPRKISRFLLPRFRVFTATLTSSFSGALSIYSLRAAPTNAKKAEFQNRQRRFGTR